jgi:hypothetical protein
VTEKERRKEERKRNEERKKERRENLMGKTLVKMGKIFERERQNFETSSLFSFICRM